MVAPRKESFLIIGSSSLAAKRMAEIKCSQGCVLSGLTTKVSLASGNNKIDHMSYESFEQSTTASYDHVLILASRLPSENVEIEQFRMVNDQTLKVLRQISHCSGTLPKVTFVSTFSLYDPNATMINEESLVSGASSYARSKLEMEDALLHWADNQNAHLLIARMPVFAYPGGKANFLNRLIEATKNKSTFTLTNRESSFSAVFDVDNLLDLMGSDWHGRQIVNCAAAGDINFNELAEMAIRCGLKDVIWDKTKRPSQQVSTARLVSYLGRTPSAKEIVSRLFALEFRDGSLPD